jgi:hypothetical protein
LPTLHGKLLKLGIDISERTLSRRMPKRRKPPSQTRKTFLGNHLGDLASVDLFTVPTATFRVLFVLIVLAHDRRKIPHCNVTEMMIGSIFGGGQAIAAPRKTGKAAGLPPSRLMPERLARAVISQTVRSGCIWHSLPQHPTG